MSKYQQSQNYFEIFRTRVSPPKPILQPDKKITEERNTKLRFINNQCICEEYMKQYPEHYKCCKQNQKTCLETFVFNRQSSNNSLIQKYQNMRLVYKRFNNLNYNKIRRDEYFASLFFDPLSLNKKNSNKITKINQISPILSKKQQSIYQKYFSQSEQILYDQNHLKFDSQFQSGNLFSVYYIGSNQYDLILQNDTNTKGNNQWFYFSVEGAKKNQSIKFNIVNLYKGHSLYNQGMKPLVYSTLVNKNKPGFGWNRYGSTIRYYKTDIKIEGKQKNFYYALSFIYKFDYDDDLVFFSHGYPYTFSMLNHFIHKLKLKNSSQIVNIKSIGKTVLKYNIPLISIGQNIKEKQKKYSELKYNNAKIKYQDDKQSIIIITRQHPGQSHSSYVCQGLISQLLNYQTYQSKFLLGNYNFFIFPMANIDGVINGNYRSNIYGYDLNRNWRNQKSLYYPQIQCIKKQINKISMRSTVCLVIDLHGHSKKMNSFFFGNPDLKNPQIPKLLPLIASKISHHISFNYCTFQRQDDKQGAARVVLQDLLVNHKLCQVYTFQVSFYGTYKNNKKIHFSEQDYKELGADLLISISKKFSEQIKSIKLYPESIIFKNQIKQISDSQLKVNCSGSDSEAQQLYQQVQFDQKLITSQKKKKIFSQQIGIHYDSNNIKVNTLQIFIEQMLISKQTQTSFEETQSRDNFLINKVTLKNLKLKRQFQRRKSNIFSALKQKQQTVSNLIQDKNKRVLLLNKLKLHGQKFIQKTYINSNISKSTQTQESFLLLCQKQGQRNSFKSQLINTKTNIKKLSSNQFFVKNPLRRRQTFFERDTSNLNIAQQVSQMIKVRKLQYRAKLSTQAFKDQISFLLQQYNQPNSNKLPYV